MKCEKCSSSLLFVDAEKSVVWCKACGYKEEVDYKELIEGDDDND